MLKKIYATIVMCFALSSLVLTLGYLSINQEAIKRAGEAKAIERANRAHITTQFMAGFYDALVVTVQVLMILFVVALAALIVYAMAFGIFHMYQRHWKLRNLPTNGVLPLDRQRILIADQFGNQHKAMVTTNRNLLTAPVTVDVLTGMSAGAYQLQNQLSEFGQLEAKRIERQANNLLAADFADNLGGGLRGGAGLIKSILNPQRQVGGSRAQFDDSGSSRAIEEKPEAAPAVAEPMSVSQAFAQSDATNWIIGRANDGALAVFNLETHVHGGVLGATGTGKSAGAGMMLAGNALKNGHQLIVLDGKGGDDWSVFSNRCEYHYTDPQSFVSYARQMIEAYNERKFQQVQNHLTVIIEEYGDLNSLMTRKDRAYVTSCLETILRKGRSAGMHLFFIDQYPGKWEPQVLTNTKAKFVYQLHNGAIVNEYHAQNLAERGEFLFNKRRYNSFHVAPHAKRVVEMSMPTHYLPLLSDEDQDEEVDHDSGNSIIVRDIQRPAPIAQDAQPVEPVKTDIRLAIEQYVEENPRLKTEEPERGELPRIQQYIFGRIQRNVGKPYISETLKEIRGYEN